MTARAPRIADRIQQYVIRRRLLPGEVLGSERELCMRLEVGRETLREAIAILEMRGVGHMRRGRHGGFVSAVPDLSLVARTFSGHALLIGATALQLSQARRVIEHIGAQTKSVIVDMLAQSLTTLQEHFHGDRKVAYLPPNSTQRITVGSRRAGQIARNIVAHLAQTPQEPGTRFGSERELMHRFAVSRSIARQVIRLLEDLNVARSQRGAGRGLFLTAPGTRRPAETIGLYLLTHAATPADSWEVAQSLRIESIRLAAQRSAVTREEACHEAVTLLQQLESDGQRPCGLGNLFVIDRALEATVGNPLLTLMMEGLKSYSLLSRPQRDQVLARFVVEHGARYVGLTHEVLGAVKNGNPRAAGEAQHLLNRFFTEHVRNVNAFASV